MAGRRSAGALGVTDSAGPAGSNESEDSVTTAPKRTPGVPYGQ